MSDEQKSEPLDKVHPAVIGFYILLFLFLLFWFIPENKYPFLQNLILGLTLVAILVYTHQTWLMQRAVAKQAESLDLQARLNILPVFVPRIVLRDSTEGGNALFLLNVG
jgi:hypothetical protein